ncbi:hypothetical protein [Parageobacillus toebii]|nr:hypothetical protein [Parageobacillus toebii]WMT18678.1 hypothetical protein RFB12_15745 [Parageobacillus toebii]
MDKQSIIDKTMETVVNLLGATMILLGVPYFIFVLVQFLLW